MVEKIKQFALSVKDAILYILIPVGAVVGYIYYLLNKNRTLEAELKVQEGDEKLKELHGEQKKIDSDASAAVDGYTALRDEYLRRHGLPASDPGLRQVPGSQGRTDTNPGPGDGPGSGDAA